MRSLCVIAALLVVPAFPQAMIEYSLGVGRAGAAIAGTGKQVGKSTGAVLQKATQALEKSGQVQAAQTAAAPPQAASPPAPVDPVVDIAAVTPGLERQELLAKLGKPSMKITTLEGRDEVEKYWYRARGRDSVVVTLRNGKVASVLP